MTASSTATRLPWLLTAALCAMALLASACGSDDVPLGTADDGVAQADAPEADSGETEPVATTPPVAAPDTDDPPAEQDETGQPGDSVDAEQGLGDEGRVQEPSDLDDAPPDDAPADVPDAEAPPADVTDEPDPDDAVSSPVESDPGAGDGGIQWTRIEPMPELLGATTAVPEQLLIADDGQTVLVRFWNGVEPCSGAKVTLNEGPDVVEVRLKTGANPAAATMTCIALASAYEIAVPLAEPLGTRELVAVQPGPGDDAPLGPPADAVFSVEQYLGLSQADAEELAAIEGRVLRIARVDDEWFALTMDLDPSRVNIELEKGIVVAATGG